MCEIIAVPTNRSAQPSLFSVCGSFQDMGALESFSIYMQKYIVYLMKNKPNKLISQNRIFRGLSSTSRIGTHAQLYSS